MYLKHEFTLKGFNYIKTINIYCKMFKLKLYILNLINETNLSLIKNI